MLEVEEDIEMDLYEAGCEALYSAHLTQTGTSVAGLL
jgi:hypothetical protein